MTDPIRRQPSNDRVVHLGMNKDSVEEVKALRSKGVNVESIQDTFEPGKVTMNNTGQSVTYDLTKREDVDKLAYSFKLPAEQTKKVADAIWNTDLGARDEISQLARIWAKGERGEGMPSRLILSGHHVGSGIWGDNNGEAGHNRLKWQDLQSLATAMPTAARNVEDLHVAACYSGGEEKMKEYRAIFPEAKTIWAYDGSAPGAASGATAHERKWELNTRGDVDSLRSTIAAHTRKGENVAVWSKQTGYMDNNPISTSDLRQNVSGFENQWPGFFNGSSRVTNPQYGPLRDYYTNVQRLSNRQEVPAAERQQLRERRDQAIRLLFYDSNVAPKFADKYSNEIRSGFESAGMQAPDFARLSRADALAKVDEFKQKVGNNPSPQARALLPLLEGLNQLNPSVIPETWI